MRVAVNFPTVQRQWRALTVRLQAQAVAGEAIWLKAANGRGKSTLLNMLAGLLKPQRGTCDILTAQGDVIAGAERLPLINYLPHNDCINVTLKTVHVLQHAAQAVPPAQRALTLEQTIADYALKPLLQYAVGQLSRGQQRRIALAVACLQPKPLRLLDEPTVGLDNAATARCMQLQQQYVAAGGLLIVTSHIPLPHVQFTQTWQL